MTQRFVKGYTNNHLTWVMVDATDFATPESALSAATKIKIYGKVKGAAGVNFVASGAGSMTNDIQHVGASALGIYTIALAKADLSDASNAWYDQYIISLSATGAAYQTIVVDGGIMESYLSATGSDILSAAVALSDAVSNAYSAAVVGTSRVLLVQSRLSDFTSAVYPSDISDIQSMLAGISNILSQVLVDTTGLNGADASDIASAVWAEKWDVNSAASTFGSAFEVMLSQLSDIRSSVSNYGSNASNYLSYISGVVSGLGAGQTASAIADKVWSDYGSKVGATPSQAYSVALRAASFASDAASGVTVLLSRVSSVAVTASDLASKVWAEKYTAASNVKASTFGSALRLNMSRISDISSYLVAMSGMLSDTYSAANATGATASAIADKVWSDYGSKVGATPSQAYSVALVGASAASDAASAAAQANSRVLLVQSNLSELNSAYTSDISDIRSMLTALSGMVSDVDSALTSQYGDLGSKIGAVSVTLGASDISDISSQIIAGLGTVDANVVQVNGTVVSGTGAVGDEWGPG